MKALARWHYISAVASQGMTFVVEEDDVISTLKKTFWLLVVEGGRDRDKDVVCKGSSRSWQN